MFDWLILVLFAIGFMAIGFLMKRNNEVYRYRGELIDRIYELNLRDVERKDYSRITQRWDILDKVSYERMVLSTKPMESFFEGEPLLEN